MYGDAYQEERASHLRSILDIQSFAATFAATFSATFLATFPATFTATIT